MHHPPNENAPVMANRGTSKIVLPEQLDTEEYELLVADIQASRLADRFALTRPTAAAIASLAYGRPT